MVNDKHRNTRVILFARVEDLFSDELVRVETAYPGLLPKRLTKRTIRLKRHFVDAKGHQEGGELEEELHIKKELRVAYSFAEHHHMPSLRDRKSVV